MIFLFTPIDSMVWFYILYLADIQLHSNTQLTLQTYDHLMHLDSRHDTTWWFRNLASTSWGTGSWTSHYFTRFYMHHPRLFFVWDFCTINKYRMILRLGCGWKDHHPLQVEIGWSGDHHSNHRLQRGDRWIQDAWLKVMEGEPASIEAMCKKMQLLTGSW